jgi:hypothetical protein
MAPVIVCVALVSIAISLVGADAIAQALLPTLEFAADTITPARNGVTQTIHINVQSWAIAGKRGNGTTHEIPLRGFYLAHLLGGDVAATIDGQTTERIPGSYWAVKAGATMKVKVLGEFAVLETIALTKHQRGAR